MKITVEVVADNRDDAMRVLASAVRSLKAGTETSGAEVNFCAGDYRITVGADDDSRTPPYKAGDAVVRGTDPFGVNIGIVEHSGPIMTGVQWSNGTKCIVSNGELLTWRRS